MTAAEPAIASVLSGGGVVPLVGMRQRERPAEAPATLDLNQAIVAEIEPAAPGRAVAGQRYDAAQMAHLDSGLRS
jgi:hypothetical protein